ncbi:hypothetical protein [Streptomyces sp. NPDC006645]
MPTDDNTARVRARDREPGKIRTTDPKARRAAAGLLAAGFAVYALAS